MKGAVVITGVGKRLGLALAHDLLEKGYRVVGTYRTDYPELEDLQAKGADLHQVDFYQPESLNGFIQYLNLEYSQLRALIHNASDWSPDEPARSNNHAQVLQRMMAIHVGAPYQMNLALQGLLNQGLTPTISFTLAIMWLKKAVKNTQPMQPVSLRSTT
nr:SDR family NAD(P)-dependent oxidoreductase [Vibrio mexicanus]